MDHWFAKLLFITSHFTCIKMGFYTIVICLVNFGCSRTKSILKLEVMYTVCI